MITKFKIFEQSENKYWKILIDDYFFAKLDKIGMPESVQNDIYEHYCDLVSDSKFVMVGKESCGENHWDWHWDFNQNDKDNFYVDSYYDGILRKNKEKFEYQGELELTQDEIDKWTFKNNVKNYNL